MLLEAKKITPMDRLLNLLKDVANKSDVQQLLKDNGCPHSGTWQDLIDTRIPFALDGKRISKNDLIALIDSAEEHGAQHVFLYSCSKSLAEKLITDTAGLRGALKKNGVENTLERTHVTKTPKDFKLSAVRYERLGTDDTLILKFLQTRSTKERFSVDIERVSGEKIEVQKYRITEHRATSTVRIRSSGLMEVRIGSAGKSGASYAKEVETVLNETKKYVDLSRFNLMSLTNFKEEISCHFADYESDVSLRSITVRNDQDQAIIGVGGVRSEGVGTEALQSVMQFLQAGGELDHSSVLFRIKTEEDEVVEIQANFRGQAHEFSLTKQVTGSHYEHILGFIRKASAKFSKRK